MSSEKPQVFAVNTDRSAFDKIFEENPIHKGDVILIAGRPNSYKDSLAFELMMSLVKSNPVKLPDNEKRVIVHFAIDYSSYTYGNGRQSTLRPSDGMNDMVSFYTTAYENGYDYVTFHPQGNNIAENIEQLNRIIAHVEEKIGKVDLVVASGLSEPLCSEDFHKYPEAEFKELFSSLANNKITVIVAEHIPMKGLFKPIGDGVVATNEYFEDLEMTHRRASKIRQYADATLYTNIVRSGSNPHVLEVCFGKMRNRNSTPGSNPIFSAQICY